MQQCYISNTRLGCENPVLNVSEFQEKMDREHIVDLINACITFFYRNDKNCSDTFTG